MDIQLLDQLRDNAQKGVETTFDELEVQSTESQIDEFNGHKREDFIIKFDQYELSLNENGEREYIKVNLGIYIEDNIFINDLKPIGKYIEVYDLEGKRVDELITIESKEEGFDIESWIEILNNITPDRYYKRNITEYEFQTYINHSISLFQGRNFKKASLFLKRCLDYLDYPKKKQLLDKAYLEKSEEYLKHLFFYLKKNELIDLDEIKISSIEERIKRL